ncbi:MAG: hypothetical protein CVT92_17305 [Bacteroidetes bacterium HGW-Bacteroidetes-1]|nr:MAG: hypothetical protein CVT92_17305 [Bacteroidetes bacterium HGW-Bacteroidetes-1]
MKEIKIKSEITCPVCGHTKTEEMPHDAFQYFYECTHCLSVIMLLAGDCCVFCSCGTKKCPFIQKAELDYNHCCL